MEAQFLDRAQLMVSGCRKVGARPRNTFSPGGLCTSQGDHVQTCACDSNVHLVGWSCFCPQKLPLVLNMDDASAVGDTWDDELNGPLPIFVHMELTV